MARFFITYFFSSVTWYSYTLQMKDSRKTGMVVFSVIHLRLIFCVLIANTKHAESLLMLQRKLEKEFLFGV